MISTQLRIHNDSGNHFLIEPVVQMSKKTYEQYLEDLNLQAKKVPKGGLKMTATDAKESMPGLDALASLPRVSPLPSKASRFIASALAAVYLDRDPILDWDENDYTYVGVIAAEMNAGNLQLDSLKWQGGHETTKAQRFVVQALAAHMKAEKDAVSVGALKDGENAEDAQAELDNDHAFLKSILDLDNKANPMSTYV